jgi:hypothetical protein
VAHARVSIYLQGIDNAEIIDTVHSLSTHRWCRSAHHCDSERQQNRRLLFAHWGSERPANDDHRNWPMKLLLEGVGVIRWATWVRQSGTGAVGGSQAGQAVCAMGFERGLSLGAPATWLVELRA